MKKRVLLFAFIGYILFIPTTKASHVYGGEIRWKCMANGKYVFFMNVYRDCTGATWRYDKANLQIFGNPLPKDSNNKFISSIILNPDSSKWELYRNGDISPQCNPQATWRDNFSCGNGDPGSIQVFFYESESITLKGTPPATGWRFVFTPPCCRPSVTNLASGATPVYKAIMYADKDSSNVDPCIDSSPEFKAFPRSALCRSTLIEFNNSAYDADLDSLVYAWDRTFDTPASKPSTVNYTQGYHYNNPTPDKKFDSLNIPATLDATTGAIRLAVFSGGPYPKKYLAVIRIDSYRYGHKISSIFREIPWVFFDCTKLPKGPNGVGNGVNSAPSFFVNGKPSLNTLIDVTAGQKVEIPLQATDYDYGGQQNGGLQIVRMSADGYLFSKDFTSKNNCATSALAPCAILQNQSLSLDTFLRPPKMEISGNGGVGTEFSWETGCQHLPKNCNGEKVESTNISFVFNIQDNHCPLPGQTSPNITIRLHRPTVLSAPIMKGASVGLDGRITYQWIPPVDRGNTFNHYQVSFADPVHNQAPNNYQILDTTLLKYGIENTDTNKQIQVYATDVNNQVNILQKITNKDWFIRMRTNSTICSGNDSSNYSNLAQIMELSANPSNNSRSTVALSWNPPTSSQSTRDSTLIYESPTHFYIWENDSIELNGSPIGGESVLSNWYVRAQTLNTSHHLASNVCNETVGFRIEARDTVISWKKGSGSWSQQYDTLVFSTFSLVDTMKMTLSTIDVEDQHLDYLYSSNTTANSYQWYDCNSHTPIAGATQRIYIPLDTGHYAVEVKLKGCTEKSSCFHVDNLLYTRLKIINTYTLESKAIDVKYQWMDCRVDTIIPNATNALFQAKDTGYYAVILSAYGYSDTSHCFLLKTLSVPERSLAEQMSYYPNPTNHNLTIKLEKEVGELKVKVRNLQGQLVEEMEYHQASKITFELKGKAGLYFVEVSNGRGERTNLKVIKQE